MTVALTIKPGYKHLMEEATLEAWAARLPIELPDVDDDRCFAFRSDTLSRLSLNLCSKDLVIQRGEHHYDSNWRVDDLQWFASKKTFCAIGLAILACVFGRAKCELVLDRSVSDLSSVIIDASNIDRFPDLPHISVALNLFEYWPDKIARHPWPSAETGPAWSLPWFCLTNQNDVVVTKEDWDLRDVLRGFGTFQGCLVLAKLMLDMSRPSNQTLEVALEGEGGFRGVAPQSAECRFWLPGSLAWPPQRKDEQNLPNPKL